MEDNNVREEKSELMTVIDEYFEAEARVDELNTKLEVLTGMKEAINRRELEDRLADIIFDNIALTPNSLDDIIEMIIDNESELLDDFFGKDLTYQEMKNKISEFVKETTYDEIFSGIAYKLYGWYEIFRQPVGDYLITRLYKRCINLNLQKKNLIIKISSSLKEYSDMDNIFYPDLFPEESM